MKSICLTASEITQILKGEKTQCRKVVKPQPEGNLYQTTLLKSDGYRLYSWFNGQYVTELYVSYKIGETIYCKEPWEEKKYNIFNNSREIINHPSITLPEEYSRCKIRITDIKCERLQDISEDDAIAEGYDSLFNDYPDVKVSASSLYSSLWANKTWKSNPWVWVYSFEVVTNETI